MFESMSPSIPVRTMFGLEVMMKKSREWFLSYGKESMVRSKIKYYDCLRLEICLQPNEIQGAKYLLRQKTRPLEVNDLSTILARENSLNLPQLNLIAS